MDERFQPVQFGRYQLVEKLAVGGMAEIFKAKAHGAHGFEKTLVVKRILPHLAEDSEFVDMFIDEAKVMVQVNHPKVVQVLDFGEVQGQYYIAMEYIQGLDGLALLRICARHRCRPTTGIAVHIMGDVLDALDYVHNLKDAQGRPLGIVHRDISPSNIFISELGEVKLGDFGIARAEIRRRHTETGALKGKYGYMSPEVVTGGTVDHRSDLFSVGIVMAELLMIRRLFIAKGELEVLLQVRDAKLDRLDRYGTHIQAELRRIIESALQRDPNARYQDAAAFRDALHRYLFDQQRMVHATDVRAFLRRVMDMDLAAGGTGRDTPVEDEDTLPAPPGLHVAPAALLGLPSGETPIVPAVVLPHARAVTPPPPAPPAAMPEGVTQSRISGIGLAAVGGVGPRARAATPVPPAPAVGGVGPRARAATPVPPAPTAKGAPRARAATPVPPAPTAAGPRTGTPVVVITADAARARAVTPPPPPRADRPEHERAAAEALRQGIHEVRTAETLRSDGAPNLAALESATRKPRPDTGTEYRAYTRERIHVGKKHGSSPALERDVLDETGPQRSLGEELGFSAAASPTPAAAPPRLEDLGGAERAWPETPSIVGRKRKILLGPPPKLPPMPMGLPDTGEAPRLRTEDMISAVAELESSGASSAHDFHSGREPGSDEASRPPPEDVVTPPPASAVAASRISTPTPSSGATRAELEGNLERHGLTKVLFRLAVAEETGLLVLKAAEHTKEIYLVDGDPQFVNSNLGEELFGQYLVQRGVISQGELSMALAMLPHFDGKLGDALVALKLLRPVQVLRHLTHQVRQKLLNAFAWDEGTFAYLRGKTCQMEAAPLGLDAFEVIGAGVMGLPEASLGKRMQPLMSKAPRSVSPPPVPPEAFRLGARPRQVFDRLDGRHRLTDLLQRFDDVDQRDGFARMVYLLVETGLAKV